MKRIAIAIVSASFFLISQNLTAQPRAVDLGLSVKWASCNVGASSPEERGDYFAWGETDAKKNYEWSTLKYCTPKYAYTKYTKGVCLFSKYVKLNDVELWNGGGAPDNKTRLELADDAARANWGGAWRTPTRKEWNELITECTWTWTEQRGERGYKVTSKTNGNSIFLPFNFCRVPSDDRDKRSCYYMSSSLGLESDNNIVMYISFRDFRTASRSRCVGQFVRPITE